MTEHAIMEMSSHNNNDDNNNNNNNNNNNLNRLIQTKYICMMYKKYTKGKKSINLHFLGCSTKRHECDIFVFYLLLFLVQIQKKATHNMHATNWNFNCCNYFITRSQYFDAWLRVFYWHMVHMKIYF